MKKYIKPAIEVVAIKEIVLLTTSQLNIQSETYDGTFDSRKNDGDDW